MKPSRGAPTVPTCLAWASSASRKRRWNGSSARRSCSTWTDSEKRASRFPSRLPLGRPASRFLPLEGGSVGGSTRLEEFHDIPRGIHEQRLLPARTAHGVAPQG